MAVGLAMLNAEKDVNAKESAAKKVEEAAEKVKKTQPRMSKNTIGGVNCFLGFNQNSRNTPLMKFLVCQIFGCDNIFVISFRRRW